MEYSRFAVALDDGLTASEDQVVAVGSFAASVCGAVCVAKRLVDIAAVAGREESCDEEEWRGLLGRLDSVCELLSSVRHPNILQFIGVHYSSDGGQRDVALVMEKLFTDVVGFISTYSSPLGAPLSLKLHILRDVSSGLRYLHSRELAHGSLQGSCVLLTRDLQAKLTDLEVTRLSEGQTTQQQLLQDYLPPESLSDAPVTGPETDCFSYGHLSLYLINDVYPQPCNPDQPLSNDTTVPPPSDDNAVPPPTGDTAVPPSTGDTAIPPPTGDTAVPPPTGDNAVQPPSDDNAVPLTQVERRRQWLDLVGTDHCLHALIQDCLSDQPTARPNLQTINQRLCELCQEHPKSLADVMCLLQPSEPKPSETRSLRDSTATLEQYHSEVESIHRVTGYLLSLHGDEKCSQASMRDSELRVLRAQNEILKKQAEKDKNYIRFLEGQSPVNTQPGGNGMSRSKAGMMSARAFLASRGASFTSSSTTTIEPALEAKLNARRSLIMECETEVTSPDQQTDAVSDKKDTEVLPPESGANSELAKKLAKRRSFIF